MTKHCTATMMLYMSEHVPCNHGISSFHVDRKFIIFDRFTENILVGSFLFSYQVTPSISKLKCTCDNVKNSFSRHSFKLLEAQSLQRVHVEIPKLWRHHGAQLVTLNHFENLKYEKVQYGFSIFFLGWFTLKIEHIKM